MRIYEEMFIVRPQTTDEELDPFIGQLTSLITTQGGTIDKSEKWGVRKLAYKVQKFGEGSYILLQFTAGPQTVRELERRLRVSDLVLKFLTVRIDEKLKKIEKRRKAREKRAARRPAPPTPQPAMPTGEGGGGGGPVPGAPMPGAPAPAAPAPAAPAPVAAAAPAAAEPTPVEAAVGSEGTEERG